MIYSHLDHLMGAYLNQDYDLSGETIEEVVQCYIDSEGPDKSSGLTSDCIEFLKEADIEGRFKELYSSDFDPALWGITAQDFLINTIKMAKR
ncbi:contact-dependent growth inhibition system immunity protein [Erwinia papayae]|uniref:Contact-dependent growth inhibition system immunity protein n=1 Tax=Erwinia papayae TaxID=206499 RepID=A0ABV3N3A8_9GAMM